MIRTGLIGAGKMGISHCAILGAHPRVEMAAVCDSAMFVTAALRKHAPFETFREYHRMIEEAKLDAVVVATPTVSHFEVASHALERGLHVFVEKPLCLDPGQSRQLAELAASRGRANQVGYHNRFIGTFREVRRLVQAGALGEVYHVAGSAFGQVVIRPKSGSTWRSKRSEGGGCLHDYASHVVDLMNFVMGPPEKVLGAHLRSVFSRDVEDAVHATFAYPGGASGQLETNWSDTSHRKMSTTIVVYGTSGKIVADRQECRVYLRPGASFEGYREGWTVRYITELQEPVWYYLRGEEYSAQIDAFVGAAERGDVDQENSFASAARTDQVIDDIQRAAQGRA
ncbi:MAG TPA: Gfo/Idh/MocA family oxidoreductase [Anaeromyxobacter sp.]|nr:Gfo/Idh/MocA family oxidoreductase [Anaeromyxobacter sp.]HVP61718.1 Gfo/Idh/MocA family oxidoreductase [Myxococcaceae bacterium]